MEIQGFNMPDFVKSLSIPELQQMTNIMVKQKDKNTKSGHINYVVKPYTEFDKKIIALKDWVDLYIN